MTVTTGTDTPVRRRGPRRVVAVVLAYLVPVLVAALLTRPQLFGVSDVTGFLHLGSFPAVRGLLWLLVAAPLAGAAVYLRRRFPTWLLVVALLAGGLDLVTVAARGTGDPLPAAARGDVTVVTVNTYDETATPEQVGRLVVEERADAVALPETSHAYATELAEYLAGRGVPMQVFGGVPRELDWYSVTSLLVREDLGAYEPVHAEWGSTLDAVVAQPVRGAAPTFAAVHTPPPFVQPSAPRAWERLWRDGAARAAELCNSDDVDVVFGDVNATLDHEPLSDLGGCVDAAAATGAGAQGTWPASLPVAVAAPIDHVFVPRASWRPVGTEVHEVGGSDHRALVARLRPA